MVTKGIGRSKWIPLSPPSSQPGEEMKSIRGPQCVNEPHTLQTISESTFPFGPHSSPGRRWTGMTNVILHPRKLGSHLGVESSLLCITH
jgi:hypothetical protein